MTPDQPPHKTRDTEARWVAKREEIRAAVVRFFATPATVAQYKQATDLSTNRAREHVLDWLDGINLHEAGKVFLGASHRGRPANLYCSDAARAAESVQRQRESACAPAPAPVIAGPILDFFCAPHTAEEFACARRRPLGAVKSLIRAEFEIGTQTLFFAGECTLEGISKHGQPYPRSISFLYCSDRWLALTSALQWAAKLWRDAGCPED